MTQHEHPNVAIAREGFDAFQRGDMKWIEEHLSDDIVWHVGGNSKWAGSYKGRANVLDFFGRQMQAMGSAPDVETHDVLGNDDHVISLGTAKATGPDGSNAEWKWVQVFHIRDGKLTEAWGLAENDAAVDPFLDKLPG
jgi:ketosteroid isomerase-like protein